MSQLEIAYHQRDEGMARAIDHAESDEPGWSDRALAFLSSYAALHGEFTAFMVVGAAELQGFSHAHAKGWGSVFRKAAREGVIRKTGRTMPHPGRHGCPADVWSST
jgi:hypothetical protein